MSNEQKIMSNKQKVTSNKQKVTSNKQKVTSNEQKVSPLLLVTDLYIYNLYIQQFIYIPAICLFALYRDFEYFPSS